MDNLGVVGFSPLASAIVFALSKLPVVKFEAKTKAGILSALMFASATITICIAIVNGDVSKLDANALAKLLYEALAMAALAYTGHTATREAARAVKRRKK